MHGVEIFSSISDFSIKQWGVTVAMDISTFDHLSFIIIF